LKRSQEKAMFAKSKPPKFVVGQGYLYSKGNRVQMNIQGKSISHFDTGTVVL